MLDHPPDGWAGGAGYISQEMLARWMPPPTEETKILVCGPPPMVEAVCGAPKSFTEQGPLKGHLKALGYNEAQVYKF